MIYESQKQRLEVTKITLQNEVNDVTICRDLMSPAGTLYTVIAVKDHELVKRLLVVFEESSIAMQERIVDTFSYGGEFILVFPYRPERRISEFYMGDSYPVTQSEDICINLLVACIDARLPWQILYLILEQGEIHLAKNDEVYLGYQIDLSGFDEDASEKACTEMCARIILGLLETQATTKAISYKLLEKKTGNGSYHRFTELYRDIRIAAVSKDKRGILSRIRSFYLRHRDDLFGILLRVSVVLVIIAFAALITQLIFGDVVWLSFLFNHFKVIGTENLTK